MSCRQFHKYSGAGNDFIVLDGRGCAPDELASFREAGFIRGLCSRSDGFVSSDGMTGADGFMVLANAPGYDFAMEFFNPDGSSGMMCGNGGRCIAAFASHLGIRPSAPGRYVFPAPDGEHSATVSAVSESECSVSLGMRDVTEVKKMCADGVEGFFLNTGARHFVVFVPDVEAVDVNSEGSRLRGSGVFAPEGANIDFVQCSGPLSLKIRTFERGVEAETLACGTGTVAAAMAMCLSEGRTGKSVYSVKTRGALLSVAFSYIPETSSFTDVILTGPAEKIQ